MNLNFFTAAFPYKTYESFIENEIAIVAGRFETVHIFPYAKPTETCRKIPANTLIKNIESENRVKLSFNDYILVIRILFIEFRLSQKKIYFLRHLKRLAGFVKKAMKDANWLANQPEINNQSICYSFWMNDWAHALAILKMKKKISKFVFRSCGFDIWDERHEGNYLPFRGFVYKYSDGIFPNSKTAEIYLKAKNIFPEKIKCMYLGTTDHGIAPFDSAKVFTIVSCSHVIALKRIHLIIEILDQLEFGVNWIHFGSGDELATIKEKAKKLDPKHQVEFKGFVTNEEYFTFFETQSVNLFITTSASEGLPVSLQEAISFGIPCLATDVGGVKEVVTPETGILFPANFDPKVIARKISEFKSSDQNKISFRTGVREFWKNKFEANSVYTKFLDEITTE